MGAVANFQVKLLGVKGHVPGRAVRNSGGVFHHSLYIRERYVGQSYLPGNVQIHEAPPLASGVHA